MLEPYSFATRTMNQSGYRQSFADFIFATNTDGSGKAASYVRALDMLGPILTAANLDGLNDE